MRGCLRCSNKNARLNLTSWIENIRQNFHLRFSFLFWFQILVEKCRKYETSTMNKIKAKNRHSNVETESDESNQHPPNLDLSLMRQPIATSITGFEEVLRAYEAGTNEVRSTWVFTRNSLQLSILFFSQLRKLLSRECDLIYECKVCRNIFRSLTNFISHKRVYCRSSFNASDHFHFRDNGFQVQDISTIIQAEQEINNNPNGSAGSLPGADDKSKDLSGIVERLLWKQHQSRTSNLNDFYDQIQSSKMGHDDPTAHRSQTLKLNRVNDSDIAVYQSLQVDNENSNMKDEVSREKFENSQLWWLKLLKIHRSMKFTKCSRSRTQFWDLMEKFWIYSTLQT